MMFIFVNYDMVVDGSWLIVNGLGADSMMFIDAFTDIVRVATKELLCGNADVRS